VPEAGFLVDAQIKGSIPTAEVHEYYAKAMPIQTTLSMVQGNDATSPRQGEPSGTLRSRMKKKQRSNAWANEFLESHEGSLAQLGPLEHLDPKANTATFQKVSNPPAERMAQRCISQSLTEAIAGSNCQKQNQRVVKRQRS
jgi:hypothetical protein